MTNDRVRLEAMARTAALALLADSGAAAALVPLDPPTDTCWLAVGDRAGIASLITPDPAGGGEAACDQGDIEWCRMKQHLHGARDPDAPLRDLVARFSAALLNKLIAAERKYEWKHGWRADAWADGLRREIREHVEKGDPRDVAAYCAFAWHHGWTLAAPTPAAADPRPAAALALAEAVDAYYAAIELETVIEPHRIAVREALAAYRAARAGTGTP